MPDLSDTLSDWGVLETEVGSTGSVHAFGDIRPVEQARRLREANRDPLERMGEAARGRRGYQRAEVRVTDPTPGSRRTAADNETASHSFLAQ